MSDGDGSIQVGKLIDGRHRIDGLLGSGGFATVYRGMDTASGRAVAIKVLSHAHLVSGRSRARFVREIHAVSGLRDPHTVRLFTHGETSNGTPFIVFELVPGEDLEEIIGRGEPIDFGVTIHVLRQVLHSLSEAHQAGLLHRDIKPANIRIFKQNDDPWSVKVLDFGIAGFAEPQDARLTKTGELLGTPKYMSPEQLLSQPLGPQSDIYGLGIVALEMLLGRDAMHGKGWSDQLERLQSGHLFATSGEHSHLHRIIERMTARDVQRRYQSADAVLRALDQPDPAPVHRPAAPVADQPPAAAPPAAAPPAAAPPAAAPPAPNRLAHPPAPPAPNRTILLSAAGLAAGFVAIVVVLLLARPSDEPTPPAPTRRLTPTGLLAAPTPPDVPTPPPSESTDGGTDVSAALTESGCGKVSGWEGNRRFTISMGGGMFNRDRQFNVYLPDNYDSERTYPVVLFFQTVLLAGEDLLAGSGARQLADSKGFIVLTIEKLDPNEMFQPDDHAFVDRALEEISMMACIDRTRVFAVGHGFGGAFARTVACRNRLAGVATVGDWVGRRALPCDAAPAPFLRLAGKQDRYAPMMGGSNCIGDHMVALSAIEKRWRKGHQCEGEPRVWRRESSGTCNTWECAAAPFVSCVIDGGHFWPYGGGPPIEPPMCTAPNPTFPMIETIWDFFEDQPSREATR